MQCGMDAQISVRCSVSFVPGEQGIWFHWISVWLLLCCDFCCVVTCCVVIWEAQETCPIELDYTSEWVVLLLLYQLSLCNLCRRHWYCTGTGIAPLLFWCDLWSVDDSSSFVWRSAQALHQWKRFTDSHPRFFGPVPSHRYSLDLASGHDSVGKSLWHASASHPYTYSLLPSRENMGWAGQITSSDERIKPPRRTTRNCGTPHGHVAWQQWCLLGRCRVSLDPCIGQQKTWRFWQFWWPCDDGWFLLLWHQWKFVVSLPW